MQITPVTSVPANGVTTGALTTTSGKARLYASTSSAGGAHIRVLRQLENGDWIKTSLRMDLGISDAQQLDFDVLDSSELLHVLVENASGVPSGLVVYMKSVSPQGTKTVTEATSQRYTAPAAASTTNIVANVDIANGALTIAAQPDVPRKLQVVVTDANSSITAGTVTVVGTGARGQALSQVFNIANQGTKTYKTADAYSHVTSITVASLAGALAGTDKINAGVTADLALPAPTTPTPTTFSVFKENVDGVDEAVGTVDAVAGTISPTTAPNATHNYDVWYSYVVPLT